MVITNTNEERVTKIDTYFNAAEKLLWIVGDSD